MKKLIFVGAIVSFVLAGCGPKMTPVEYNDAIIGEQNKINRLVY